MKKLSKAILITLAVVVTLGIVAIVGANLYLQSPGVQARLQAEISKALRVPLTVTNTSLTPWSDLRITGITIPHQGTNLLEAASFRARYRFWPLLGRRLVIYEMSVEQPKIVWQQNAEGKWVLPEPDKAAQISAQDSEAERSAAEESGKAKKATGDFQVVVEGFQIHRGSVELLDKEQQPVATLTDVNIGFSTLESRRMEGIATIARAVWTGNLTLDGVRSSFTYIDGALSLPDFTANAGGGTLTGTLTLDTSKPKSPFVNTLKFEQADLGRMTTEAGWPTGHAAGMLSGTLDLRGDWEEFARAEGRAKLALRDGQFREFPYLEMIGQVLQIKELTDSRFQDSQADLRIADEKAFVESLTMKAPSLQLSAKGVARFDGKLQLAARLTADEDLVERLPGIVQDNFIGGEGEGGRYIDFNITGKTNKPKTDLMDKVVGQKIESQFDDWLSSIFSTKGKKEEEAKKADAKAAEKKKKKDEEKALKAAAASTPKTAPTPPQVQPPPSPVPPASMLEADITEATGGAPAPQ